MKQPNSSVRRVRTAFDQAQGLQLVDDAAQCDRLDIEKFRQFALVNALVLGEVRQHLPIADRVQPGAPGVLLEPPLEKPGHVVQQEAQRGVNDLP